MTDRTLPVGEPGPAIHIQPAPYVTVALAAALTGLTEKAIHQKIVRGVWVEGREFRRQDGRIYISMRGYAAWVEGETASRSAKARSASGSRSTESSAATP